MLKSAVWDVTREDCGRRGNSSDGCFTCGAEDQTEESPVDVETRENTNTTQTHDDEYEDTPERQLQLVKNMIEHLENQQKAKLSPSYSI